MSLQMIFTVQLIILTVRKLCQDKPLKDSEQTSIKYTSCVYYNKMVTGKIQDRACMSWSKNVGNFEIQEYAGAGGEDAETHLAPESWVHPWSNRWCIEDERLPFSRIQQA